MTRDQVLAPAGVAAGDVGRGGAQRRRRMGLALLAVLAGLATSSGLAFGGATPGLVLVPLALGVLVALALVPFPQADYALAFALIGTLPVLPPSGLPNVPLAALVIVVALARVVADQRSLPLRPALLVGAVWLVLGVGIAISEWPPVNIWLRPAAVLAFGLLAALLGVVVWRDVERLWRWSVGIVGGLLVVAATALLVFATQYVIPVEVAATAIAESLGYLRGEAAAVAFEGRNNWMINGTPLVLRAFSPLFPAPNGFGGYLGIAIPIALVLTFSSASGPRVRLLALSALALAITGLVVSYSRSSWVAAVATLILVGVVAGVSQRRSAAHRPALRLPLARMWRVGLVVLVAGAIGAAGVMTTATDRAWGRITNASSDPSVTERIEGDREAAERIESDPWRGTGLGNWPGLSAEELAQADRARIPYVHNLYLEYAAAAGLLGAVWVVLVLGGILGGGFVAVARGPTHDVRLFGLALLAIGTYTAVQALFDDNLLNPQLAWLLFWTFGGAIGLAAAISRNAESIASDPLAADRTQESGQA